MMKSRKLVLIFSVLAMVFATSCDDDDDDIYGNWVEGYQFDGNKRSSAVSFTIDDTFYFGLGYNGSRSSEEQYFSDFQSYAGGTSWTDLDAFPGELRQDAFSFALDGKGYIGCGFYGDTAEVWFSDVWSFDPNAGAGSQWQLVTDSFPGGQRTEMVSFVVGGKAYVAGGVYDSDEIYKDCFEFDGTTFTQVEDMGYKRAGAFSFVIGDKAYIGGGYDNGFVKQFEVFNSETEIWNEDDLYDLLLTSDFTDDISFYDDPIDLRRRWTTTFVVNGKGYIAGGNNGSVLNDCYEYDPATDYWTEKNSFESSMYSRYNASSFVLNEVPYIIAGTTGSSYLDDVWSFEPDADEDEND